MLFLGLTVWYSSKAAVITDTDIKKYFSTSEKAKDVHSVMMAQGEKFHTILDGFLSGDKESIKAAMVDIDKDMKYVSKNMQVDEEEEPEVWQSILSIVQRTKKMKSHIDKENYQEAYTDFTVLMAHCIQCHEATRGWGSLEPEVLEKVEFVETAKPKKPKPNEVDSKDSAPKSAQPSKTLKSVDAKS